MAIKFLKKGSAAKKELEKEAARKELQQKNKAWRFWMPNDGEGKITFLDGNLNDDGILDQPHYYEHQVHMNGSWRNWFVCTSQVEEKSCPICEGGATPSYVCALTVIDHNEWEDRNGKMHKNERRLFIAKADTIKLLTKKAQKHEGLAGCTFEVMRTGDKSANVGSSFDFEGKTTLATLKKKYKDQADPFNYDEVIQYISPADLRKLGFGATNVVGTESAPDTKPASDDMSDEL